MQILTITGVWFVSTVAFMKQLSYDKQGKNCSFSLAPYTTFSEGTLPHSKGPITVKVPQTLPI